jgi:hypothetical protein
VLHDAVFLYWVRCGVPVLRFALPRSPDDGWAIGAFGVVVVVAAGFVIPDGTLFECDRISGIRSRCGPARIAGTTCRCPIGP